MYSITFEIASFDGIQHPGKLGRTLAVLLGALFEIDCAWLRSHPKAPGIYESGVRYQREPEGQEHWQDIRRTLELGHGDCEDLACWRAAELVVRHGIDARPLYKWKKTPRGGTLYHIVVATPHGIEDPSKRLGMVPRGSAERVRDTIRLPRGVH